MPTTIYDASQVTKRRMARVESGDAAVRQQQYLPIYAAHLGIYDQSIVNTVRMGRMVEYQKRSGAIVAFNGCPCEPLTDPAVLVQQQ